LANNLIKALAPAKINLFLHITSKREDGYHNLQTWFQFIELRDYLSFEFNNSQKITIESNIFISEVKNNIVYKTIREFEKEFKIPKIGVNIKLEKNIPMGAGLGGGSSNSATTILVLNQYFKLNLSQGTLIKFGVRLGADVPIFLYSKSAWAEGIGDILQEKPAKEQYALIFNPKIHASTESFFTDNLLKKDFERLNCNEVLNLDNTKNVFTEVFFKRYPQVQNIIKKLGDDVVVKMSGTGASFFILSDDKSFLEKKAIILNKTVDKWLVKTVNYISQF